MYELFQHKQDHFLVIYFISISGFKITIISKLITHQYNKPGWDFPHILPYWVVYWYRKITFENTSITQLDPLKTILKSFSVNDLSEWRHVIFVCRETVSFGTALMTLLTRLGSRLNGDTTQTQWRHRKSHFLPNSQQQWPPPNVDLQAEIQRATTEGRRGEGEREKGREGAMAWEGLTQIEGIELKAPECEALRSDRLNTEHNTSDYNGDEDIALAD